MNLKNQKYDVCYLHSSYLVPVSQSSQTYHILQENLSYHVKCFNLFEDTSFGKKKAIDQVIWEVAVQLNKNHICENELKSNCKLINFKLKFSNVRYWI